MPRTKSTPVSKRPLIDDTPLDADVVCFDRTLNRGFGSTRSAKKQKKSKTRYEFAVDPEFEQFLSDAKFFLTINYFDSDADSISDQTSLSTHSSDDTQTRPESCHSLLGSLAIQVVGEPIESLDLNTIDKRLLYIYAKPKPFTARLYYECNETRSGQHFSIDFSSLIGDKPIQFDLIDSLYSTRVYLTSNFLLNDNQLIINVWLLNNYLQRPQYQSKVFNGFRRDVLCLMNYFYDFPILTEPSDKEISKDSVDELYSKIKAKHILDSDNIVKRDVQHPALRPTLRSYQTEAVQWMLQREHIDSVSAHQVVYERIQTKDGKRVCYNKYLGYFAQENSSPVCVYGITKSGILADEMGLGKTIEVLSCILCNPKPSPDFDVNDYITDESYDCELYEDCFACVCGEICDIEYCRRNNAIISSVDTSLEDVVEIDDSVDSDATIEDDAYQDIIEKENLRKIVVQKIVNNRPVVRMIERKSKRRQVRKKAKFIKKIVQCLSCGSYQHSTCVNYDPQKERPYYCGHCWVREGMKRVASRATLIVSPRSISHQWQDEITKHVDCSNLNIFVYEGVKSSNGYVQPFDLADNDIVLTTYETLQSEIDFVNLPHANRLRYPKRFNSTPSPLTAVDWWRICLDEAQMVENSSAKTARMAHNLSGQHRWCITGTPIQRSINDIQGLLLFIGEEPFHEKHYWDAMLRWPYASGNYEPMITALSHCFWRTSKKDVWDQLGIPEQTSTLKPLMFSPVEEHFYMRQHSECQQKFNEKMRRFSDLNIKLKSLDKKTANLVITPLLSLRQACCHPQAVRGKFLSISKKTLTMEELLENMIKNTQYECEEEHRKIIFALNGMAAIDIIRQDFTKAIDYYRQALTSIENYKDKALFRTDKLQKYHTLYNLADILEKCGIKQRDKNTGELYSKENEQSKTEITVSVDIGRTLRDEHLMYEAIQINDEYLAKGTAAVANVRQQLGPLIESVSLIIKDFNMSNDKPWWRQAVISLRDSGDEFTLIERIKDKLGEHSLRGRLGEEQLSKFVSISTKFNDSTGLIYVLDKCLRELHQSRLALKQTVKTMSSKPSEAELNEAVDCHLRPIRDKEGNRAEFVVKCKYCRIHEMFNAYEMKLYYFSAEEKVEEATCKSSALMEKQRRGNWDDSETEQSLKQISHMFRTKFSGPKLILDDAKNHLKLFDALKKEFRGLRAVWTEIFDFVSQIDELNMAKIRLRLRFKDEPKPLPNVVNILEEHELPDQFHVFRSDEVIAKNALAKKLSHLYYLNNLSKDESYAKGGRNMELCPICKNTMGKQWSVLQCGHSLCVICLEIMIHDYARTTGGVRGIGCAVCREACPMSAIFYVNSTGVEEEPNDQNQVEVKGSWSTKIEDIVRCLILIEREDPTAKTLVFSTWTDVLQLISNAFLENNISHCLVKNSAKFTEKIDDFKQNESIKALLMPMSLGSKGLNLIEATHVVLVEPTLNRANELQAVGRVHRIGQTKPTFVHRFIVKKTIEERIHYRFSSDSPTDESNSLQSVNTSEDAFITLNQIKRLFESE